MHVLIIEDRKDLALMLKKALEEKEHSAVVAFDGLNGLMHAEAGDFDAIVLDLMLPGLSGQDITRKLRSSNSRKPSVITAATETR